MPAATKDRIELRSPNASLWLSVETSTDTYDPMGGRRMVSGGRKIVFQRGRAEVPADMADELRAHKGYGKDFWLAEDLIGPLLGAEGPAVASGQLHGRSNRPEREPLEGWDTLGPRELRARIEAGQIADPRAALMWEAEHRGRAQVMTALSKVIGATGDDEDDFDEPSESIGEGGFVQPVPDGARGV